MSKKNTAKVDVSIIVNVHNEGLLLHKSIKSLNRNIIAAGQEGIKTEVIIVADKIDKATAGYLENKLPETLTAVSPIIEKVAYGDLGLSRNHGIDRAQGECVGNLDGDDLWSDNWITEAVKTLRASKANIVVHHAVVLNFGTKNGVWHIKSSTDPSFDPRSVIEDNWWPSCMMTQRSTFEKVRYHKVLREHAFSFEDWLFNCECLINGIEHIAVPETTFFYRRKDVSMLTDHITGLPTPNEMFTVDGLKKYLKQRELRSGVQQNSATDEVAVPSRDTTSARKIIIKTIKYSGKTVVKVGTRYAKPYLDSHHRLKNYLKDIKMATHTLIADPDEALSEGRKNIPGWLRNHWYVANQIEPLLFPTHHRIVTAYSRAMMTMGIEQASYWDVMEKLGDKVDYLLVMPYVRRAGAYMVGMHYVKAYKEIYPDARVVVLTTEDTYSSIEDMVPEGVDLVSFPEGFSSLKNTLKQRVLAKVFTNLKPKYIHAIHSREAFQAMERYPAQISHYSKLFLSTFNYDYTSEGQRTNAFLAFGQPILPYVTKVFTDNEWVAQDTIEITGVTPDKVSAHAMPINLSVDKPQEGENLRAIDGNMRILWAARLAKQKRPDILYEVAKAAHKQKLPYEFVVYGELYDKIITQSLLDKMAKLPNVQFRGAFHNGIQSLPTGEFEVFLCTSEAEGTPNAILEAQERSLVVVAPNLGGIPEAVEDKRTGLLVEDFDDVSQYLAAFEYIYNNQERSQQMAQDARRNIEATRSWQAFVDQFKQDL